MPNDRKRRVLAIVGSVIFLLIAPMTVVGLVPWWITRWRMEQPFGNLASLRVVGVLLILSGIPALLDSFARFAIQGLGTPAPVFPTRHLVVHGLYRFVRNPMYVGLLMVVTGQALFFGSLRLLEYGAFLWLGFHLFVLVYEERKLRATFGEEYETFCAQVPRWIPHARPWDHSASTACR
jgi:protein-S-isoprenylcysteine O-methyltransferase Ste14